MASTYKLSRLARVLFALAAVGVPVLTVIGMFVITDDGLEPHQDSRLVSQYVDTEPADPARASEQIQFSTRYGRSDGTETLVLYDDEANRAEHSEMYAIAAGNLATHFGMVNIQTLKDYQSGDLQILMPSSIWALMITPRYQPHLSKMSTQPIPPCYGLAKTVTRWQAMTQLPSLKLTVGIPPTLLKLTVGPSKKSAMMAPRWTAIRIPPGTKL